MAVLESGEVFGWGLQRQRSARPGQHGQPAVPCEGHWPPERRHNQGDFDGLRRRLDSEFLGRIMYPFFCYAHFFLILLGSHLT